MNDKQTCLRIHEQLQTLRPTPKHSWDTLRSLIKTLQDIVRRNSIGMAISNDLETCERQTWDKGHQLKNGTKDNFSDSVRRTRETAKHIANLLSDPIA